jgi:hypothetical protein
VQNELPLWEAIDVNFSKAVSLEVTGCVDVMPVPRENLGPAGADAALLRAGPIADLSDASDHPYFRCRKTFT